MEIAVLIPAYQPDSVLISLVQALHRENFRLIVTDDGSGPAYADIFFRAAALCRGPDLP